MSYQQPAQTGINLKTGFLWLAFLLWLFKPKVSIDGAAPVTVGWGESFLPVPPGAHRVNVWFDYLFFGACGKAELVVTVPSAGRLPLEYRAPTGFVFSPGKLTVPTYGAVPAAVPMQATAAPAAAGPQWDEQRGAWVQYDVARQSWLQFDDTTQQWGPIS